MNLEISYHTDKNSIPLKCERWKTENITHREDDLPAYIEYYIEEATKVQKLKRELWIKKGEIHRENGPAYIHYDLDGNKTTEVWFKEGWTCRKNDLPSLIKYYSTGKIYREEWIVGLTPENAQYCRKNKKLPTSIVYYPDGNIKIEKYRYGKASYYRDNDLPCEIHRFQNGKVMTEKWYNEKELHREGKPAIINYSEDGEKISEEFYLNGKKQ